MAAHRSVVRVLLFVAVLLLPALVPTGANAASLSMLGADVSSAQRSLDLDAKYYDASGTAREPLDILKRAGVNYAPLRIWNYPASGYHSKRKEPQYGKTVKS